MTYQPFTICRRPSGEVVGHVEAQSAEQAVFRLVGGEWGRSDFAAYSGSNRPMAAKGLTSYRYENGAFGFVMIGARDHAEALREAARSVNHAPDPARLEVWSAEAGAYVQAGA